MSEPTARELLDSLGYGDALRVDGDIEILASRVEKVLALHHPTSTDGKYCTYCGRVLPCPTLRILNGEGPSKALAPKVKP